MRVYVGGQRTQRREDPLIVGIVGTELHSVTAGKFHGNLESIDRIKPESVSKQRRFGLDVLDCHVQIQGIYQNFRQFLFCCIQF